MHLSLALTVIAFLVIEFFYDDEPTTQEFPCQRTHRSHIENIKYSTLTHAHTQTLWPITRLPFVKKYPIKKRPGRFQMLTWIASAAMHWHYWQLSARTPIAYCPPPSIQSAIDRIAVTDAAVCGHKITFTLAGAGVYVYIHNWSPASRYSDSDVPGQIQSTDRFTFYCAHT